MTKSNIAFLTLTSLLVRHHCLIYFYINILQIFFLYLFYVYNILHYYVSPRQVLVADAFLLLLTRRFLSWRDSGPCARMSRLRYNRHLILLFKEDHCIHILRCELCDKFHTKLLSQYCTSISITTHKSTIIVSFLERLQHGLSLPIRDGMDWNQGWTFMITFFRLFLSATQEWLWLVQNKDPHA